MQHGRQHCVPQPRWWPISTTRSGSAVIVTSIAAGRLIILIRRVTAALLRVGDGVARRGHAITLTMRRQFVPSLTSRFCEFMRYLVEIFCCILI